MLKAQLVGPKGDLFPGPAAAVARVTPEGESGVGVLHADLVRAPGAKRYLSQRASAANGEGLRSARFAPAVPGATTRTMPSAPFKSQSSMVRSSRSSPCRTAR